MYDEISFDRHILFLKIKRVFLLIFLSIIGCILGIIISTYLIELVMLSQSIRLPIIACSTLIFFGIALARTEKTRKEIKDETWKFEVLKSLSSISKKLDHIEHLNGIKTENHPKQVRFTKVK